MEKYLNKYIFRCMDICIYLLKDWLKNKLLLAIATGGLFTFLLFCNTGEMYTYDSV